MVPTAIVAAAPLAPGSPFGISKSNTAADVVPEFVTSAGVLGDTVVTVPTAIVAAAPGGPGSPVPGAPFDPFSLRILSITKPRYRIRLRRSSEHHRLSESGMAHLGERQTLHMDRACNQSRRRPA